MQALRAELKADMKDLRNEMARFDRVDAELRHVDEAIAEHDAWLEALENW